MINFKDFENINNIAALVSSIDIPEIPDSTNFWLIRTESGIFYDEYVDNEFVALSWNSILPSHIMEAIEYKEVKDRLYEKIKTEYKTNQPGTVFGKCNRFINKIREGDIFMIPDKSNVEVTFAIAGEYYEETDLNTTEEEFIAFKKGGWEGTFEDKDCPYIKRRRIEVVKRVSGKHMNPNLYRALASRHGLNIIDPYEHADDILSSIYPLYLYQDKLSTVFQIKAKGKIDALPYSSFIYNTTKQININGELDQISVKSNVNSPGSIVLDFIVSGKDIIKNHLTYIVIIWIVLGGGKAFGLQFNSVIKSISDALDARENRKKTRAEIRSIEIDNDIKEKHLMDRQGTKEFVGNIDKINIDETALEEIAAAAEPLDIDISELSKVIDLKKYKKNRDS